MSDKQFLMRGIVLDIGGGRGRDLGEEYINLDIRKVEGVDIVADAHHLPLKDEIVDTVISTGVVEHLKDPQEAIIEIRRILRSCGCLILFTAFLYPIHSGLGWLSLNDCVEGSSDYWRFTEEGVRLLLVGFESIEIYPIGKYFSTLATMFQERVRRSRSIVVRVLALPFVVVAISLLPLLDVYDKSRLFAVGYFVVGTK